MSNAPIRVKGRFSSRMPAPVCILIAVGVLAVPISCATMAAQAPAGVSKAGIPFTVLDTHGWGVFGGPLAATSLPDLLALIRREGRQDLQIACPTDGCLVGTVAPARTLVIAFSPSNNICNRTTKLTVEATSPRELSITTDLTSTCDDSHDGAGSRPPAPDLLLAVPLNQLPASGAETILTPDSIYAGSTATTVGLG